MWKWGNNSPCETGFPNVHLLLPHGLSQGGACIAWIEEIMGEDERRSNERQRKSNERQWSSNEGQ